MACQRPASTFSRGSDKLSFDNAIGTHRGAAPPSFTVRNVSASCTAALL